MIVRPTGRGASIGILGVAALIAAFAFGTQALVPLGAGMVALPLLAILLVAVARTGIEPTRVELAAGVRAGDVVRVTSDVRHRPRRPRLHGLAVARATPDLTVAGTLIERRPGEELLRLERGVWQPPGPRLEVQDPLGLARATRIGPPEAPVVVPPRVIPLEPAFVLACAGRAGARRRASVGTDLDRVREYRAGDPLSRVHWAQTAKRGQLQTKVLTGRTGEGEGFTLALDVRSRAGDDRAAFEEAVVVTASLAHAALMSGVTLSIELHGDHGVQALTTARRGAVDRLLAEIQPGMPADRHTRRGPHDDAPGRVVVSTGAAELARQSWPDQVTTIVVDPSASADTGGPVGGGTRTITTPDAKALATILGPRGRHVRAA